jgi:hypothetical protein
MSKKVIVVDDNDFEEIIQYDGLIRVKAEGSVRAYFIKGQVQGTCEDCVKNVYCGQKISQVTLDEMLKPDHEECGTKISFCSEWEGES